MIVLTAKFTTHVFEYNLHVDKSAQSLGYLLVGMLVMISNERSHTGG